MSWIAKNTRPQTLNIVRRVQLALEESRQFIFQGLFCLIKYTDSNHLGL